MPQGARAAAWAVADAVRARPVIKGAAERVHCAQYLADFRSGRVAAALPPGSGSGKPRPSAAWRRVGLPWSPLLVERTFAEAAGTLHTARLAMRHGVACSTAGGTHHAHRERGGGFCIVNDLAICALELVATGEAERVLVVDLDVHHGDGTAALLGGDAALDVFAFSMHCQDNWPLLGAKVSPGDLDVGLPSGSGDVEYLAALRRHLPQALAYARPDVVLYDAGVDVHEEDKLGLLRISDEGLLQRERYVLETCLKWGSPVAAFVGGGYHRNLDVLAARHCVLHGEAQRAWLRHCA